MQRKFSVLSLSPTGWERKEREPKSRDLPTSEFFLQQNTKDQCISRFMREKIRGEEFCDGRVAMKIANAKLAVDTE